MLGSLAQDHSANRKQHQPLQSAALTRVEQCSRRFMHGHGGKDDEKQRNCSVYRNSRISGLRNQEDEQQQEDKMQTHFGAEESANRNGPGAHEQLKRFPNSQL